ncbi:hypothetical protein R3P38DRAFT_3176627 [Favolaschia claudopus]|uniref:Transmembrane protein n=1 Tax=Favolaschia claudopus TaxID=2862362 RepID=A0AAW0CZX4_9AGAR
MSSTPSWNFTIDDTSPFLTYTPFADSSNSGLPNGWIPWYQTSGFLTKNGNPGVGTSYHITSLNNASVAFDFYGSALYLYGNTNASYSVVVDGSTSQHTPPSSSSDLLFQKTGLDAKTHSVTLSATFNNAAQQFAFDRAVISTPITNNEAPTEAFYDNLDTAHISYSGTWTTPAYSGIPNTSVTHPFHTTDASASATMQIGRGAVGVSLWGMANWGNWVYQVSLDGTDSKYNGSTFFQVPDALLFYQGGLDPTTNHTVGPVLFYHMLGSLKDESRIQISLTNTSPSMKLSLNSIRVFTIDEASLPPSSSTFASASGSTASPPSSSSPSGPSKHSVNVGAIAGSVIGAVWFLLVLVFVWWYFRRRRQAAAASQDSMTAVEQYAYVPPQGDGQLQPYSKGQMSFLAATGPLTSPTSTSLTALSSPAAVTRTATASGSDAAQSAASGSGSKRRQLAMTTVASPTRSAQAVSSTSPSVVSPSSATTSPEARIGLAVPDVDRLIELIAQRIDPEGSRRNTAGNREEGAPPPEYRG